MVVQTFRLGNLGGSTDGEVAKAILGRIKRFGDSPDNFFIVVLLLAIEI